MSEEKRRRAQLLGVIAYVLVPGERRAGRQALPQGGLRDAEGRRGAGEAREVAGIIRPCEQGTHRDRVMGRLR